MNTKMHMLFPRLETFVRNSGRMGSRLPGRTNSNYMREFAAIIGQGWQKLALLSLYGLGLFLGAKTASGASSGWQAQLLEMLQAQRMNRISQSVLANALGLRRNIAVAHLAGMRVEGYLPGTVKRVAGKYRLRVRADGLGGVGG